MAHVTCSVYPIFVQFLVCAASILVHPNFNRIWITFLLNIHDMSARSQGHRARQKGKAKIERASRALICEESRLMLFNISIIFFCFLQFMLSSLLQPCISQFFVRLMAPNESKYYNSFNYDMMKMFAVHLANCIYGYCFRFRCI